MRERRKGKGGRSRGWPEVRRGSRRDLEAGEAKEVDGIAEEWRGAAGLQNEVRLRKSRVINLKIRIEN